VRRFFGHFGQLTAMDCGRRAVILVVALLLSSAGLAAGLPPPAAGVPGTGEVARARGWSGWSQVPGGELTSDATGPIGYRNSLYVVARGSDHAVWVNRYNRSRWRGWQRIPGKLLTDSSPGAVVYNKRLYVVVRGGDDGVWVNRFNGSRWRGWRKIVIKVRRDPWPPPGVVTLTSPSAVVYRSALYVFVRDANHPHHVIWFNRYDGSRWRGWRRVPGDFVTPSSPEAVSYRKTLYVVVRRGDEEERSAPTQTWINRYRGARWRGWRKIPGTVLTRSSPGAVVYEKRLYAVVRGTDDRVWANRYNGSRWRGWRRVPGKLLTESGPDGATYEGALHLFVTGTDKAIYVNRLDR
jgi:hypothetical protein